MLSSVSIHRLAFDLPFPPNTAYAYLLPTDEPVLIDAGALGDSAWEELEAGLGAAGFEPSDVDHLFVTHPHTDHAGQVSRLLDVADPTLYTPIGVRERLLRDSDELAATVRTNARAAGLPNPEDEVDDAVGSLERNRGLLPPDEIDVELEFGEPIQAGGVTIEPIHAPGHQQNQAAFLVDDLLFAGDAIAEPFRPAALHVGLGRGCRDAIDAFYGTLDRLAALDVDRVYPGHGPIFDDLGAALEESRDDLDELVASSRDTLSDIAPATAYEVTEVRTDDPRRIGFEIYETVGALARLERQGVVNSSMDDGVRRYE